VEKGRFKRNGLFRKKEGGVIQGFESLLTRVRIENAERVSLFLYYPQKEFWLLRLSISIKRVRVENYMKDFQMIASHLEGDELLSTTKGAT